MSVWAVVPVKPFVRAKSRLSNVLSPKARARFSRECAERTLTTLAQCASISRTLVISRDPEAWALAEACGALPLQEARPGLNGAVAQAAAHAVAHGATAVLVVPSDLPFVTAAELAVLAGSAGETAGELVIVCPDRRDEGTNALLLKPPCVIEPAFGRGSLRRHVARARSRGAQVEIRHVPGVALDVDTADDLRVFQLHDPFQARRSIRRYADRPVDRGALERALTAATWAPSAHNRQPWRFVVITSAAEKDTLASAMGARLRADRAADGDPADAIEADARRSHARITGAPVVVLACMTMSVMDRYADARRAQAEEVMAVQSTAMALQNLLLAAHAEGLGACWMCAPLFCPDDVRAALDLPADWRPQALITLGHPAGRGKPATRVQLDSVVRWA